MASVAGGSYDSGYPVAKAYCFIYISLKMLKILLAPGFVLIRNDFIEQADYKKFSIREIM